MVNIVGIVVLVIFYLAVLAVGILATRWFKKKNQGEFSAGDETEISIVAGRKLGGLVGIFTMTATTVGGGYINGTAESVATQGLIWTLAPFGIFIGLTIGGLVLARPMRKCEYVTMFDPFQNRYNGLVVVLLYLASLTGDIFWSASILAALGTSLSVILDLNVSVAIITSASISVLYTMFGQMIAVAYTDVIQLSFIIVGLVLSIPFAMTSSTVGSLSESKDVWLGQLDSEFGAVWTDLLIAMTLGTIPWQSYFQRVLSVKSVRHAQLLSVAGACGAMLLSIPPVLIGIVSVSTNWTVTDLGQSPADLDMSSQTLPLVLFHLTPTTVAIFGLGAISAAVMSSIDSSILASSSLFVQNIYRVNIRKKAGKTELLWLQRISIVAIGATATALAIFSDTVYGMFIMAADIVFVILFPQLTAVLFSSYSNSYGAIVGYFAGLILRLGAGEPYLNLDAVIFYPYYDSEMGQLFPFRTFAMLCSLFCILCVSKMFEVLFTKCNLSTRYDILKCFKSVNNAEINSKVSMNRVSIIHEISSGTFKKIDG